MRIEGEALEVNEDICNGCHACLRVGCPALMFRDGKAYIQPSMCIGESCELCLQACPSEAIHTAVKVKGR